MSQTSQMVNTSKYDPGAMVYNFRLTPSGAHALFKLWAHEYVNCHMTSLTKSERD